MGMLQLQIQRFAASRGNVVTRGELRWDLDIRPGTVDRLVNVGVLSPIARGVYFVGPGTPELVHHMRAACALRPDVGIGGFTAAALWGLRRARRDVFELLIPTGCRLEIPKARLRRTNRLEECDLVEQGDRLRVTTPARTLFDQAWVLDPFSFRSMAEDALNKELVAMPQLREVASRLAGRGRGGSRTILSYLESRPDDQAPAMSELELLLGDALRSEGLDVVPQVRVRLPTGRTVFLDLAIMSSRVDVEIDHSEWHTGLVDVQRDKTRDVQLVRKRWQPVRFTDRDVLDRLAWVVASVVEIHMLRLEARAS